jgi:hypothetical protein
MSDDPGKKRVMIFTRNFEIKGDLHIYDGVRLTDYINESRAFIAVTDAEVKRRGEQAPVKTSFLNVSKNDIEIIFPEDALISGAS